MGVKLKTFHKDLSIGEFSKEDELGEIYTHIDNHNRGNSFYIFKVVRKRDIESDFVVDLLSNNGYIKRSEFFNGFPYNNTRLANATEKQWFNLCEKKNEFINYNKFLFHINKEQIVNNQRELLFAFEKFKTSHIIGATDEWRYANVDLFLSKHNI